MRPLSVDCIGPGEVPWKYGSCRARLLGPLMPLGVHWHDVPNGESSTLGPTGFRKSTGSAMVYFSSIPRAIVLTVLAAGLSVAGCADIPSAERAPSPPAVAVDFELDYDVRSRDSGCVTGVQSSGALFEVCKPEGYDGTLVIYAHGFVLPQLPLTIPESEGGFSVKQFVVEQGHGYAATSYYTNGLVDPKKGVKDIRELLSIFTREFERPQRTYIVGYSNGSFLSTLLMEKSSGLIDGALLVCSAGGSYTAEIQYLSDVGVLFDHFFGDIQILPAALGFGTGLPGDVTGYHEELIPALEAVGVSLGVSARDALGFLIGQAMIGNPDKAGMLLQAVQTTSEITRGRTLFASQEEAATLVVYVMVYNVFNASDATSKLGGAFFGNENRVYADLHPNPGFRTLVNAGVQRYSADPDVTARLHAQFETKGHLKVPTVALHTTRDPLVPVWQHDLYIEKLGRWSTNYDLTEVEGFGHCTVPVEEVASAWTDVVGAAVASR